MRLAGRIVTALLLVTLLPGIAGIASAAGNDSVSIAALMQQLESADAATRMGAVEALSQAGAEAIGPLFGVMGGQNRTLDLAARLAVERMVQMAAAPQGAAQRAEISRGLVEQALASRPVEVRTFAVRMIAFIGHDEAVPALARLLAEPGVAEIARWALVRIPGPASVGALAAALPQATGELKIGIINALGARRDTAALPALEAAANVPEPAVRAAALAALARIPDSRCATILGAAVQRGGKTDQAAAWDAYVKLGEQMLAAGKRAEAEKIYRQVYGSAPNEQLRCAGIAGLGKTGRVKAVRTVLDALASREREVRAAAYWALAAAPGREATAAIADRMIEIRGSIRAGLAHILALRGDRAAVKPLTAASMDKEEIVRIAASQALGEMGDPAAVAPLIARLRDKSKLVRGMAELSLIHLRGKGVTGAEVKAMVGAPESLRAALIRALGNREDGAAMPALLDALSKKSKAVRLAALEGIGVSARLTDAAARSRLMGIIRTGDKEERQAAEGALSRVPVSMIAGDEKSKFAAASSSGPAPMRAALLRIMGRWNDPSLMNVLVKAGSDANQEVAVAALGGLARLLGQPVEPAAASQIADELVRIAGSGTPATKAAAMQGYLALADQRRASDGAGALEMYHRALGITTDDEDRRIALRGIGAIGDVKSLPVVEPLLEQGAVAGAAAAAVMPIAEKLAQAGDKERAIALYRKAIRASSDRGVMQTAVERLRGLGVDIDLAAEAGFVTHWWVLGPFAGRKQMSERDVVPTGAPINLGEPVTADGKTYNWKYVRVSDPVGMLDLREAVAQADDCAAYAYGEVTSDTDRDVIFKIGSDDAVVCWLNGKHIHSYNEDRGYAPDQDIVPTHLRAGMNFILMKVLNGGADWACGLRITDRNNMALRLPQRKP